MRNAEKTVMLVDKTLAASTVFTKPVDTETNTICTTETDLAKPEKIVKTSTTSTINPKAIGTSISIS